MKKTTYLVRPHDFHIFEIDSSNECYRSYSTRSITRADGTRPEAQSHFTYENLTRNFDFIPIDEVDLPYWERKHDFYLGYQSWATRSDGHGGSKGGTIEEYKMYLDRYDKLPIVTEEEVKREKLNAAAPAMLKICEDFIKKVETGKARSKRTYSAMKEILNKIQ